MIVSRLGIATLLVGTVLAGCGSPMAPVTDRSAAEHRASRGAPPGQYRVQRGDTLYSISFSYGLDYRDVANWNGIDPPYRIYPGQHLRLRAPAARAPSRQARTQSRQAPRPRSAPRPKREDPTPRQRSLHWQWPTRGSVIRTFSATDNGKKGIDIAGDSGQPVRAAADGEVVYSGQGLLRYGKLIIIKHDQTFFSAYAHNRVLLVTEGQRVKGGQTIAELGSTGTSRPMLHFEVRRNGHPVDPLAYLPH